MSRAGGITTRVGQWRAGALADNCDPRGRDATSHRRDRDTVEEGEPNVAPESPRRGVEFAVGGVDDAGRSLGCAAAAYRDPSHHAH